MCPYQWGKKSASNAIPTLQNVWDSNMFKHRCIVAIFNFSKEAIKPQIISWLGFPNLKFCSILHVDIRRGQQHFAGLSWRHLLKPYCLKLLQETCMAEKGENCWSMYNNLCKGIFSARRWLVAR